MFGSPLPSKKVIHTNSFVAFVFVIETRKTRMATSTRFSEYEVVLPREPASFWRENVIAVAIPLRVFCEIAVAAETSYIKS